MKKNQILIITSTSLGVIFLLPLLCIYNIRTVAVVIGGAWIIKIIILFFESNLDRIVDSLDLNQIKHKSKYSIESLKFDRAFNRLTIGYNDLKKKDRFRVTSKPIDLIEINKTISNCSLVEVSVTKSVANSFLWYCAIIFPVLIGHTFIGQREAVLSFVYGAFVYFLIDVIYIYLSYKFFNGKFQHTYQ